MALHRLLGSLLLAGAVSLSSAAGPADPCVERGDAVVRAAAGYIGVREATGRNDGDQVELILGRVGLGPGYSWCGAFVYVGCADAGVDLPGGARQFAWAPSWHPQQRRVWQRSRGVNPRWQGQGQRVPMPGDVFGVYYSKLGRIGHVGIVERWGTTVITIEGNTSSGGSRDGDGVYRRRRLADQLYCVSRWHC